MPTPIYVVDAFTDRPFAGNPAGVCILPSEADPRWMQSLAAEMRHAETAFLVRRPDGWDLRWFTPSTEVDLCGHATLASAHILWETELLGAGEPAVFHTRSGILAAHREEAKIVLDFPVEPAATTDLPGPFHAEGIRWTGKNRMDWIVAVENEQVVRNYVPNFAAIAALGLRGLILTAASDGPEQDFVSRFFAPQSGVDEDPVTGSAHCCLGPYWAGVLGKRELVGYQASPRGGFVGLRVGESRVDLIGNAVTVLSGALS